MRLLTLSIIVCLFIVGCGSGNGSLSEIESSSTTSSLGGTVATGAPIENAAVTVRDALGQLIGTTTTDASGKYSLSFDSTKFTPPFVIRADGLSGDTGISLTSVASVAGQANVTQLTNAIAASLSNSGNPLDLSTNTSSQRNFNSASIELADQAYRSALSGVMSAMGVSGSLISSTFSGAMDKLLDNVSATVQPSGQVILGTSAGKVGNDLAANSTATAPYTSLVIASGALPNANSAASLITPTDKTTLTIGDLEVLRSRLDKCFKQTSSSTRGTPQSPSADCADAKFVVTSDLTQANSFKHSSFKWNSQNYSTPNNTSWYWAGIFGYMLTQSKYDGATFLTPRIIRPLDSQGTTWAVKFPILFADGTVDQLGDMVRSPFMVVKRFDNLASGQDKGFRFIGDQRDFQSYAIPVVQKIVNQVTGDYRYETGINLYVGNFISSTDATNRKPVVAKITGKGLPAGGAYVAQKFNGSCGSYLPITSAAAISKTGTDWTTVNTTYSCAGVFVLAINYSNSYTTLTTNNPRYLKGLGNDGNLIGSGNNTGTMSGLSTSVGNYLSDSDIASIGEGEPYTFEIILSDGSSMTYVNRLATRPLTPAETQGFAYYPTFSTATQNNLLTFVGATSAAINFGISTGNVHPWSTAIYWGTGVNGGTNSVNVPYTSNSVDVPCTGTSANSCGLRSNWVVGTSGLGLFQVRSRTADGLDVYSQIRNGF